MAATSHDATLNRGFTLAELLIVMIIIILLIGILLPALASVRARSKKLAARAQLTAISSACETYATTFGAYPGYFSEAELNSTSIFLYRDYLTSNENMVLSLLGRVGGTGWTINAGRTPNPTVNVTEVGTGPRTAAGKTYGAFYSPKADELGVVTGGKFAGCDSNNFPELIDPTTDQPILYWRVARNGNAPVGVAASDGKYHSLAGNLHYLNGDSVGREGGRKVSHQTSVLSNLPSGSGSLNTSADNLAWFLTNGKLSNYSNGANGSDDVLAGALGLMSPGPDKVYFDKSQDGRQNQGSATVANEADAESFDDLVTVTGG